MYVDSVHMLDGARVLVVEDDYFISVELDRILTAAGAEVIGPCRTLAQANDLVGADGITCAILDVRLGCETSLPVARKLNERGVPFLFLTGQLHTGQLHDEWRDAKVISKPFHRRTIVAAVAHMLETDKHAPQQARPGA